MKKYYCVGTRENRGSDPQEYTAYCGFDFEEAKKAFENEKHKHEYYSTKSEKEKEEVFAEYYMLPDDIDESDEDEVINAVCDCIGCDPIFD